LTDGTTGEVLLAVSDAGDRADVVELTTLEAAGLLERQHLQEWIVAHPEILGAGVKVVAVEYDAFVVGGDSQRSRLDVLGLDADGRLVVAELKRGFAPDTVDMQVIKYAAMASRFRLETLAAAHTAFLGARGTAVTVEQAGEALLAHAELLSDETLANPKVVIVAQGFSPIVISSAVWLSQQGVDLSLVRFQPYRHASGQVFVTFSTLYPLPDIEKSLVAPGTPPAGIPSDKLPWVDWTEADLVALGRAANIVTKTTLDLCADRPDQFVSYAEIIETAGVTSPVARSQFAHLTMLVKRRFGRRNRPYVGDWNVDGTQQAFYKLPPDIAKLWHKAAAQLDAEQADADDGLA
jgi:hypothetical protein